MSRTKNNNLHKAKKAKFDEFYTQLSDIEKEVRHYTEHFKGKSVFLNCDDPTSSAFWKYFSLNFEQLGLTRLVSTHFTGLGSNNPPPAYSLEITSAGESPVKTVLTGDGDFRSEECVELLKSVDIVITNPPFSLLRPFIAQLMEFDKKFLILGTMNAITYKEIFPLLQSNEVWLGVNNGSMKFSVPSTYPTDKVSKIDDQGTRWVTLGNIAWFTNLEHYRRRETIDLFQKFSEDRYFKYSNAEAINVDKVVDIPEHYVGVMGVPISFLTRYNPDQFKIVGFRKGVDGKDLCYERDGKSVYPYFRILIQAR